MVGFQHDDCVDLHAACFLEEFTNDRHFETSPAGVK